MLDTSGGTVVVVDSQAAELKNEGGSGGGGSGGGSEEEERSRSEFDGDKNFSGGNRWPHEETLALLKIRSEMDLAFRDSNLKSPLWDEISRKMAELGYNRNAKKCREKFENIYKYHKRTKDGRSGRQNGKNYRFFEQLELLDHRSLLSLPPSNHIKNNRMETITSMSMPVPMPMPMTMIKPATSGCQDFRMDPFPNRGFNPEFMSTSTSTTSSSGKDQSDGSVKKKRKLAGYFERLMKQVLDKQEDLQNKFLEAIEKCEKDRVARDEAWKMQEIARLKKEQESLAQERAISAAKDAAVISFLQKISEQTDQVQLPMELPQQVSQRHTVEHESESMKTVGNQENILQQEDHDKEEENTLEKNIDKQEIDSAGENSSFQTSSSRWPKAEVEALISLRTNADLQYQDNGSSKGPLWEDISIGMKKLGYDRNAKRCKEKWENINKYYRRVKESQKKRPEDSKTCPYFHQLDSIYQNKSKKQLPISEKNPGSNMKAGEILMQIINQQQQQQQQQQSETEC